MKTHPNLFSNIFNSCQQIYKNVVSGIQACAKKVKEACVNIGNAITSAFKKCSAFFSSGKTQLKSESTPPSVSANVHDNKNSKGFPGQPEQTSRVNQGPVQVLTLPPKKIEPAKSRFNWLAILTQPLKALPPAPTRSALQVIFDKKAEEQKLALIPYEPNIFLKQLETKAEDDIQKNSSQTSIMQTLKQENENKIETKQEEDSADENDVFYDPEDDDLSIASESDDDEEYFDCDSSFEDELEPETEKAANTNTASPIMKRS